MKSIVVLVVIVALVGLSLAVETKSNISTTVAPVTQPFNSTLAFNVTADAKSKLFPEFNFSLILNYKIPYYS
jgi:hypothetical protein